jgi:small-conductance mechanosensitive channel
VVLLAWAWNVDLIALTRGGETLGMRIARSALSIVVILLLADLFWQLLKALIDRQLAATAAAPGTEMAIRQARLRTLLPILRNIALVVIASLAVLMTLSELGVEIGPLIAGAGVVGVAVGFGAQTIVKDIISGIFYLLDDAFRVGEYIQSGKYQGTVESFSLRSVRLRAPRGPVFTVPFGELGAIENLSRDWAIDKFQIGVTYDTDLEKARKLIRKVGEQLKADPEMGPKIIEPLKMQGVQEFGSYAIQLRVKQTTRPGEQFGIRRKAYAMIKKAFDENGIAFAFPTVQVAGGAAGPDARTAVANQAVEMMKPPPLPVEE